MSSDSATHGLRPGSVIHRDGLSKVRKKKIFERDLYLNAIYVKSMTRIRDNAKTAENIGISNHVTSALTRPRDVLIRLGFAIYIYYTKIVLRF